MMQAIVLLKILHIAGILLWSAGLIALPLMLAQHKEQDGQFQYQRIRRFTHYGYTHLLTPAAVIAVAAGTALLFLRGVFVPWMFAKLVFVAALVALHAWIGGLVVHMGEHTNEEQPSPTLPLVIGGFVLLLIILLLVLTKPVIGVEIIPEWLLSPRNRYLPLDEVPS